MAAHSGVAARTARALDNLAKGVVKMSEGPGSNGLDNADTEPDGWLKTECDRLREEVAILTRHDAESMELLSGELKERERLSSEMVEALHLLNIDRGEDHVGKACDAGLAATILRNALAGLPTEEEREIDRLRSELSSERTRLTAQLNGAEKVNALAREENERLRTEVAALRAAVERVRALARVDSNHRCSRDCPFLSTPLAGDDCDRTCALFGAVIDYYDGFLAICIDGVKSEYIAEQQAIFSALSAAPAQGGKEDDNGN